MPDYRELSRRGLINMCTDFDEKEDGILHDFLEQRSGRYETVRAPELALDKVDKYAGVMSDAYNNFKKAAAKDTDSVCSTLIAKAAGKAVGKVVKHVTGGIF